LDDQASAGAVPALLLTPDQAAASVGLTPWQLWNLRKKGGGPKFVALGMHIRYPLDELEQWARSQPRYTSVADRNIHDLKRGPNARRQSAGSEVGRAAIKRPGKKQAAAPEAAP
jgi:hypothetical protein